METTDENQEVLTGTVVADSTDMRMQIEQLEKKKRSNWIALLLMLLFSAVNIPYMLFFGGYFSFSLCATQIVTTFAFQINRVTGDFVTDASGNPVLRSDSGAVWALAGICILLIALYLVLILLSRKTRVTLYIAFGLFMLDTLLVLLTGLNFSMLFNLAFHAWVLYSFVVIIRAENKIRRLYPNAG